MRRASLWTVFCGAFVLLLGTIGAYGAELKSAEELAALLQTKIGKSFDIPTEFSCDVITAEQRDDCVILFKSGADWNDPASILWRWDPKEALPDFVGYFAAMTECKPNHDCSEIAIAASGGGVARVRFADKKVIFYGNAAGNTHSIATLPDGNVVTASSTGNYLALFAPPTLNETEGATEATPIYAKYRLVGAHGVVWDAKREILWALGTNEIAGYEYVGTKEEPGLKEIYREELTGNARGGHDLYPAPGYDALMTTGIGVNVFDPNERKFYEVVPMRRIKSVSLSPEGVPLMQRAVVEWWSDTIFYGDDKDTSVGVFSGAKFYKARWFVPNEFSGK
jgi:hypothetical protein